MDAVRGFSVIEILVAMSIAAIVISAVLAGALSGASSALSARMHDEALVRVSRVAEEERALARRDFSLVAPNATTTEGAYSTWSAVDALSDGLTKRVTAYVAWQGERGRSFIESLPVLVVDLAHAGSPAPCTAGLTDAEAWRAPARSIVALPAASTATDIAAFATTLLVTSDTNHSSDDDLFIFDIFDPGHPVFVASTSTGPGLAAVRIARDAADNRVYAYLANTSATAQLQVVDATDPSAPRFVKGVRLTGNTGVGNSVALAGGRLYLGLTSSGGTGPEFNVFDIAEMASPAWKGGYATGRHVVNAIAASGEYAYIAKPTDSYDTPPEQVSVLDVSDASTPGRAGGWRAPHLSGNGKSLALGSGVLYVGRTETATDPELWALDRRDPTNPGAAITNGIERGESVRALAASGRLLFALAGQKLFIFDIALPGEPTLWGSVDLGDGEHVALSCAGDTLYAATALSDGTSAISVIAPSL